MRSPGIQESGTAISCWAPRLLLQHLLIMSACHWAAAEAVCPDPSAERVCDVDYQTYPRFTPEC
eukprot:4435951-Heterocapsa_arctica.AAC.1